VLRRPLESSQYLSFRYSERLADAGIVASVGCKGDSFDNALAETINGLYKTEVIRRCGPWRHADDVEYATLDWVDWFNNRRLPSSIGDVPPAEYEAMYYREQTQAMAASWNAPRIVDTAKPQNKACSKASGLTPPRWLCRRCRL
jgi:hypothetical protein